MATRLQIIRGAAEMFDRSGFERTSLGEIVEQSGITKGALYFHFKSKDELARVVIEEQHNASIESVRAIARTNTSALEQIVMLCHEMARQMIEEPVVRAGIRLTLEMSASTGPATPYVDWISSCERLVQLGIEQGDVVDTVVPAEFARFTISAFTGVQLVSNVLAERSDLEDRVDQMWKVLLPGIVPPRRRHKMERIRHARWDPKDN